MRGALIALLIALAPASASAQYGITPSPADAATAIAAGAMEGMGEAEPPPGAGQPAQPDPKAQAKADRRAAEQVVAQNKEVINQMAQDIALKRAERLAFLRYAPGQVAFLGLGRAYAMNSWQLRGNEDCKQDQPWRCLPAQMFDFGAEVYSPLGTNLFELYGSVGGSAATSYSGEKDCPTCFRTSVGMHARAGLRLNFFGVGGIGIGYMLRRTKVDHLELDGEAVKPGSSTVSHHGAIFEVHGSIRTVMARCQVLVSGETLVDVAQTVRDGKLDSLTGLSAMGGCGLSTPPLWGF